MLQRAPIFLFGCAYRCGSTLLQRYITSTRMALIWGEQHGLLAKAWPAIQKLKDFGEISAYQASEFDAKGARAWVANLNPPFDEGFPAALRAFLTTYYESRTRNRGFPRWGFKENTCGLDICSLILDAFPSGRAVFLVRHPRFALASVAATPWYNEIGAASGFINLWIANSASFLRATDPRILVIRYEDLVRHPETETRKLAEHLGLPREKFDQDAFRHRVGGTDHPVELGPSERRELGRYDLEAVMRAYGYGDP